MIYKETPARLAENAELVGVFLLYSQKRKLLELFLQYQFAIKKENLIAEFKFLSEIKRK